MAFPATISYSPIKLPFRFQLNSYKLSRSSSNSNSTSFKRQLVFKINASSTSIDYSNVSAADQSNTLKKKDYWQWKFSDKSINIYHDEHEKERSKPDKNMLMIPTISDVRTVEEWSLVALDILQKDGSENLWAVLVDWPGLGNSDQPKFD